MKAVSSIAATAATLILAACAPPSDNHWLGYIEGENALIAAPSPGWITSVEVMRGAEVKVGDALFTLDATSEIAARDNANSVIAAAEEQGRQAEAQIVQARQVQAQAEADVVQTQKELQRQQGLVATGATPRRDLEAAQAAYDSARARRAQALAQQTQAAAAEHQADAQAQGARANLAGVQFNLSERSVQARVAGRVEEIYFRQGEYANAGTPVISVLPPANVYVRFFVPETEVANLKLGSKVHIGCDGCAADLTGTLGFVAAQAEFTPPVIYSTGNRERLVFKAEARVAGGLPLRPGVPAEVWPVDEAAKPKP